LTSRGLFTPIFVPEAVQDAVSDEAWLRALLDVEAALAVAEAAEGVIPAAAAAAIAASPGGLLALDGLPEQVLADLDDLGHAARAAGNPVVPLVARLREAAGAHRDAVHFGATSQDILDSAAMLVASRALVPVGAQLDAVADACAALARAHRGTVMAGRTLLQQAVPVTFGLKAAGWLAGVAGARARLRELRLPAQLGGAAGTLSKLGDRGPAVVERFAAELGLAAPPLPWHGDRRPVAELGAALAVAAGAVEKVALDVVLLAQTEVGEVAEATTGGRGGSSAMPHKQNPVGAVRARAAARTVRGAAGVLLEAMAAEHERAAGAWHSEWRALSEALAFTGGAAWSLHEALAGLTIDPERMRANMTGVMRGEDVGAADEFIDRALALYDAARGDDGSRALDGSRRDDRSGSETT
jgi:3-carboxy-cis,cis-muconate cycloisomerase